MCVNNSLIIIILHIYFKVPKSIVNPLNNNNNNNNGEQPSIQIFDEREQAATEDGTRKSTLVATKPQRPQSSRKARPKSARNVKFNQQQQQQLAIEELDGEVF